MKKKIAFVFGTRPEAIKMAPLVRAVQANEKFQPIVLLTGQHPTMAKQVMQWFDIEPDFEGSVNRSDNSLNELTAQLVANVGVCLTDQKPDLVIVQGDTASAFAGAIAAFNSGIPVAHLEAGLRTHDINSPFPEEAFRQMISRIARLHMCPTWENKKNLLAEGIPESQIMVTGNTVVDAFSVILDSLHLGKIQLDMPDALPQERIVLVTTHRRENLDTGMSEIAQAIAELSVRYPEVNFVIPMHPNPAVRERITPVLHSKSNVFLLEPLGYPEFITILAKAVLVLTDSGGVQEEAPILGIPALVLRENTERPEGVVAGGVKLIGASRVRIIETVDELFSDSAVLNSMTKASNPYGDGNASKRCVSMIESFFGIGKRDAEFLGAR